MLLQAPRLSFLDAGDLGTRSVRASGLSRALHLEHALGAPPAVVGACGWGGAKGLLLLLGLETARAAYPSASFSGESSRSLPSTITEARDGSGPTAP